jgi:spectinomycin phosphotransferase
MGVRVAYPLPVRDGGVWADLAGMPFALFPYLPGEMPLAEWPPALFAELGRVIAAIHRATPDLSSVLPPRETFALAFEPDLRRGLDTAAGFGPDARPGLRALRDWVLAHRENILAQIARLHGLQANVARLDGPFVLCHMDLHGKNLLVDGAGALAVLDWDDVMLAPPEYDLSAGLLVDESGAGLGVVLDAYRAAGGAAPLHLQHFAFYLLRRHVDDAAFILRGLETCVARWTGLDETLALIAAALGRAGSTPLDTPALDTPAPPGVR